MAWVVPTAARATESCSGVRDRPSPSEPARLSVPPGLAVLCLPSPVFLAEVKGVGEALPFSCNGRCGPSEPSTPGEIYQLEGADGQLRRVVTEAALWYAIAETDSAVRRVVTGPPVRMTARSEGGACVGVSEEAPLRVGKTYVAYSPADAVLLDVVIEEPTAPQVPRLTGGARRSGGIPCRTHGAYAWAADEPNQMLVWRVLAADGSAELVPPWISHEVALAGFAADEARAGELVIGQRYVIEVQAIARDGRTSPPTRIELELEETHKGDPSPGMGPFLVWVATMIGIGLLGLVALAGVVAIVVLVVIKVRADAKT